MVGEVCNHVEVGARKRRQVQVESSLLSEPVEMCGGAGVRGVSLGCRGRWRIMANDNASVFASSKFREVSAKWVRLYRHLVSDHRGVFV